MTLTQIMKARSQRRDKETMVTHIAGAQRHRALSLDYKVKARPGERRLKRRSPTLSTLELRRLVAAMVD